MRIVTIVGARPQFIKAAALSKALREAGHCEFLVHTGQHYDFEMSRIFFDKLDIPDPAVNLEVGSGPHGWQTGQMLIKTEGVLMAQRPDFVLVFGDTNSTLAGALAACKMRIPLGHVEAGLRSFNPEMAEEHNRVVTDRVADLLLCPTRSAVANLEREGVTRGVHLVGDVMFDSVLYNLNLADPQQPILKTLNLIGHPYALATVHRAENTDSPVKLRSIFRALEMIARSGLPVVVPLHPRTRQKLESTPIISKRVQLIAPVSCLDMLALERRARVVLTDSGGVQKEAYWAKVPCVTLRNETEWVETVQSGWNVLVGTDSDRIVRAVKDARPGSEVQGAFGDGRAAEKIVHIVEEWDDV